MLCRLKYPGRWTVLGAVLLFGCGGSDNSGGDFSRKEITKIQNTAPVQPALDEPTGSGSGGSGSNGSGSEGSGSEGSGSGGSGSGGSGSGGSGSGSDDGATATKSYAQSTGFYLVRISPKLMAGATGYWMTLNGADEPFYSAKFANPPASAFTVLVTTPTTFAQGLNHFKVTPEFESPDVFANIAVTLDDFDVTAPSLTSGGGAKMWGSPLSRSSATMATIQDLLYETSP